MNPPQFDQASDVAELTYLNEASVVNNLHTRYLSNSIYTYSGLFLVAVNPYKALPIYDHDTVLGYKKKQRDEAPPHIYATTDLAFRNLLEMFENQSILVTGESGAGKTENTKKVIQYLAAITSSHSRTPNSKASFEQQILQANPILEAFGNAQTVRNNNSSRFGKFIRIEFSRSGQIAGASIDWYLLEKSRVISQNPKERNYHIFYQILAGADKQLKKTLMLEGDASSFSYLKSSNKKIPGVDDSKEFKNLLHSLKIMGISSQSQANIFRIMAAILHIGNIQVGQESADQGRILNPAEVEKVAHLLGVNPEQMIKSLLRPKVKAGREWVTQSRSADQVRMSLDALSKSFYERTFGYLVDKINETLERSSDGSLYIGVLDIAGFEIFDHNSFEQLCINYTNEKLQQFFNHHMFVLEQEEYARENIDWKFIDFGHDLQPTIDLIEKPNPMGIFSCLDEDCVMPKATDKSFTEKLGQLWTKKSTKFVPSKLKQGFKLTHYAAEVEYSTEGWLEKNKDPLNDNVVHQLVDSSEDFVRELFQPEKRAAESTQSSSGRVKRGIFRTVAQRHKEQLNHLMDQLQSTHPHFVRCIIPNLQKKPLEFDNMLVLEQLRCNGVLEGIRIARTGFPNRLPFSEFRLRYEVLVSNMPNGFIEGQTACSLILKQLELDDNLYKVGLTKVFFKAGVLADLEERREVIIRELITKFQTIARGSLVRRKAKRDVFKTRAVSIIQKNLQAYLHLKEDPWWKLYVKMKPLLLASRESGQTRIRDGELKKLEQSVKEYENDKIKLEDMAKKAEHELERINKVLEGERMIALDKEEILRRAQAKEVELQDQLTNAYDDLDKLETQCEELFESKKKLENQSMLWKKELENGASLIGVLETERKELRGRISSLTDEMLQITERQKSEKTEVEKLMKELKFLKSCIVQKDQKISELEAKVKATDNEIEVKLQKANASYETANRNIKSLIQENKEARLQVQELNKVSSEYEELVKKKEKELLDLSQELKNGQIKAKAIEKEHSSLQSKYVSLTREVAAVKEEKEELQKKHKVLEKEAKESRELLQAKVSESEKHSQGKQLLDKQLEEARKNLAGTEEMYSAKLLKLRGEVDAKQKLIENLQRDKDSLLETDKKLKLSESQAAQLQKDLEHERLQNKEMQLLRNQLTESKGKLKKADTSIADLNGSLKTLSKKLEDSSRKASKLDDEIGNLHKERKALESEISMMKRENQDFVHQVETLKMKNGKLNTDLEGKNKELSNMMLEKKKLNEEVQQKASQMDKLRASITEEVEKRIHKLIEEKTSLESTSKKLKIDLESINLKYNTLDRQKNKLTQEIEDLAHDLVREQKNAAAAEAMKQSLQQQVEKLRNASEQEKRNRSEKEVEKRKLAAQLDKATMELEERTKQLSVLQKVVRPKSAFSSEKSDTSELVDLALRLEESEKRRKKAEQARALIQDQLDDTRKRWSSELDEKDSQYYSQRRALLDELADISATNPPGSPMKRDKSTFGTQRLTHTNQKASDDDKENVSKELGNKSPDQLREMLVSVQKTKNELLGVYHETSKNLVQTREQLSAIQKDKSRLEREISRGSYSSDSKEISDLKMHIEAEVSKNKDLTASMKLYKTRAEEYYNRLEQAETIVLKATRAETFAKTQQADAEEALKRITSELRNSEKTIATIQSTVHKLEGELEERKIDLNYTKEANARLTSEFDVLKGQRSKEMSSSQTSVEAMRSRYSEEIRAISSELETEKLRNADLESQHRKLKRELEDIKTKSVISNTGMSPSIKGDLESKIEDLSKANEEANLAYHDSQMRIGSLLSQVRNLRSTLGDITSDRDQLQKDKRTMEQRLNEAYQRYEELAAQVNDPDALSRQKSMRGGSLKVPEDAARQINELKIALSNQTEASQTVLDQLRRTKQQLKEDQEAIEKERRLNIELKKIHEKEKQALHLKIVDLEARLLAPQSDEAHFYKSKAAELEKQLRSKEQSYIDDLRQSRSADRDVNHLCSQLGQKDKMIGRLQDEGKLKESQVNKLKKSLENIQAEESSHRMVARRAEREARAAKERALELEKEVEEWRQRAVRYGAPSFV